MASRTGTILVLFDSTIFTAFVIAFRHEVFLVTTRTRRIVWTIREGRVLGRIGKGHVLAVFRMTASTADVLVVVARISAG